MDNPFRYIVGGMPFDLSFEIGVNELRQALAGQVVDPISELMEASGPARTALLSGSVDPDRVRLRTPRRVRAPFWPLSPVLRGRLLPLEAGRSRLESRLFILRWPILFGVVAATAFIAQPYSPMRWYGAAIVVVWLAEFVFVLPRTRQELARRVRLATVVNNNESPQID